MPRPRLPARVVRRWSLGVLIGGVACTAVTDTPSPALQASAEVTVTLPAVHLGPDAIQAASADIQLIPANRAQAVLGRQTRAADQFTQAVTVPVNIAPCSGATTSCSAVMVVRFLNAAGVMIDSTEAGPFTIIGGGRTAAPSVQPRVTARLASRDTVLRASFRSAVRASIEAFDATGAVLPGRIFQWRSADAAIATVDSTGAVTARAVGRTVVTATREGNTMSLPVESPAVELFSVSAPSAPVMAQGSAKLLITLLTAPGQSQRLRIESSDSSVATADAAGVITPLREGVVQFTVRPEADSTRRASATLIVDPFRAAVSWRAMASGPLGNVPSTVQGVWGADDQAVWAATCGAISFYDGNSWRADFYRTVQGFCANGMTGTSRTDVYAVGNQIWRYDGAGWVRQPVTFSGNLLAAVMVDGEVVAVGDNGLIVRGRGSSWRTMPSGTNRTLRRIASDGRTAYIAGDNGTLLRLENDQWVRVSFPNAPDWYDVLVKSATEVYVAGADHSLALHYLVQRYDGRTWTTIPVDRPAACCNMRLLFNTGGSIRALGDGDWIFRLEDGRLVQEFRGQFGGIFTSWANGNTVMLGGHHSSTIVWRNGTWNRLSSNTSFNAMWATSPSFIVGGGDGGIDLFNGTSWSLMRGDVYRSISTIWGSGPTDIWAVGSPNTFLRFRGAAWEQWPSVSTATATGIWGVARDTAWAVFNNGDIMRFNGTAWQTIFRTRTPLNAIHGSGARHLIAVGTEGRVWVYGGRLWQQEDSGIDEQIQKVWVFDSLTAFATAGNKLLERRNGVWRSWTFPSNINFQWVMGTGPRDVYAGGCGSPIVRYDGTAWSPVESQNVTNCAFGAHVFPTGGLIAGNWNRTIIIGTSPFGVSPGLPR